MHIFLTSSFPPLSQKNAITTPLRTFSHCAVRTMLSSGNVAGMEWLHPVNANPFFAGFGGAGNGAPGSPFTAAMAVPSESLNVTVTLALRTAVVFADATVAD